MLKKFSQSVSLHLFCMGSKPTWITAGVCSALCNQVRRREVGNQLYELQEQTVVRREDTKPVTHQQDYEESYFGEKKVFDKDYIECESDQTVLHRRAVSPWTGPRCPNLSNCGREAPSNIAIVRAARSPRCCGS